MFFTSNGQTLYLSSWNYNATRVINELAKIVENNNGIVKKNAHDGYIVNRSIIEKIRERQSDITRLEGIKANGDYNEKVINSINNSIKLYNKEIKELQSLNNEPLHADFNNFISFVFEGNYYYYQFDENFLFNFNYQKTPIINGNKISWNACLEASGKEWVFDCLFDYDCKECDIKEAANILFNYLVNARNTEIIRNTKKRRVKNTYNNSWHYETITEPETFQALEWLN